MAAGLILIGIGPGGVSGMTLAAIDAAKSANYGDMKRILHYGVMTIWLI